MMFRAWMVSNFSLSDFTLLRSLERLSRETLVKFDIELNFPSPVRISVSLVELDFLPGNVNWQFELGDEYHIVVCRKSCSCVSPSGTFNVQSKNSTSQAPGLDIFVEFTM